MAEMGKGGRWLFVGPQIEDLLGYTPEEWCADSSLWYRSIHPDDREQAVSLEAEREGAPEFGVRDWSAYRLRRRDGTYVWVRDDATIVRDAARGLVWYGAIVDISEQVDAEEARAVAEERYRTLIDQVPAVIYEADIGPSGQWRFASPQIEDLLGYTPQEWCSHPDMWLDRLHPDDRDMAVESEADRTTGSDEYRLRRRDGSYVWVRDDAAMTLDADGTPHWRGVLMDISARKNAEADLAAAERRYRTVIESLREGIVMRERPSGRVVAVNASACKISGLTAQHWYGERELPEDWVAVDHDGNELPLAETPGPQALLTGETSEAVIGMGRRGEPLRWVSMHSRPIFRDGDPLPYAAVTSFDDITDQLELARRDQLLAMVIDSSEDAVFTADLDQVITSWNPAAETLYGYTAREAIGMPVDALIPHDRLGEKDEVIVQALEGRTVRLNTKRQAKDGRIVDVAIQVRRITGPGGAPVGFASIVRDVGT
jgi:PAS domain S-box-containing protein